MAAGRILVVLNKFTGESEYYTSIKVLYNHHSFSIKENMMGNYLRGNGYEDEKLKIVRVPLINE